MTGSLKEDYKIYLHEMGLSDYETNAYLALLQQGSGTAKEISSAADIPQSRVYDVLERLETKGFVTVQPGRPKQFGSVEPKIALNQYTTYRRKNLEKELEQNRKIGEEFLDALDDDRFQFRQNDEIDVFWSYKGKNYILEHGAQLCQNATNEIRMVTKGNSFCRLVNHHGEVLKQRADHGVTTRIIVPVDEVDDVILDSAMRWSNIRDATGIEARFYLYGQDHVLIAFLSDQYDRFVAISTESTQLYATLGQLFDLLWENADAVS
jgi:sugar-specific transcriptional regulator TrmB